MKKYIIFVLSSVMVLLLCSCGKKTVELDISEQISESETVSEVNSQIDVAVKETETQQETSSEAVTEGLSEEAITSETQPETSSTPSEADEPTENSQSQPSNERPKEEVTEPTKEEEILPDFDLEFGKIYRYGDIKNSSALTNNVWDKPFGPETKPFATFNDYLKTCVSEDYDNPGLYYYLQCDDDDIFLFWDWENGDAVIIDEWQEKVSALADKEALEETGHSTRSMGWLTGFQYKQGGIGIMYTIKRGTKYYCAPR